MASADTPDRSEQIVIASTCEDAQRVIGRILDELRRAGWHQDDIFAVHIALEESLSNAIKHCNRWDPRKNVTVSYIFYPHKIDLQVADEGEGFDPEAVPDPTLPENLNSTSGRGLCLIRGFMDRVRFKDRGRVIWMERSRHHGIAGGAAGESCPTKNHSRPGC
jgi:serine/threonine-protein kinase RsbW